MASSGDVLVEAFVTDDPVLYRRIKSRLAKAREEHFDQMRFSQDWPDFKFRNGYLAGLDDAIKYCELCEKELRGR